MTMSNEVKTPSANKQALNATERWRVPKGETDEYFRLGFRLGYAAAKRRITKPNVRFVHVSGNHIK